MLCHARLANVVEMDVLDAVSHVRTAGNEELNFIARHAAPGWKGADIPTQTDFLASIWHEVCDTRILTPHREPRSLMHVMDRMVLAGVTFADLADPAQVSSVHQRFRQAGLPPTRYKPDWFVRCDDVYQSFSQQCLGKFLIRDARDGEDTQTPGSTLYIWDGSHRSLVYAYRVLVDGEPYVPVECVWMNPCRKWEKRWQHPIPVLRWFWRSFF